MNHRKPLTRMLTRGVAALAVLAPAMIAAAQSTSTDDRFLLVRDDLTQIPVQVGSLDQQKLHYLDAGRGWRSIPISECLALLRPDASTVRPMDGAVYLSDGQLLPGAAISNADPNRNALAWDHIWVGRMELPLGAIASVTFGPHIQPPPTGVGDVVLLTNGDQLTGLVIELGDPVVFDPQYDGESDELTIPAERVAAVSLVTQSRLPEGQRVWFADGTIINARRLLIGDDSHVRLAANPAGNSLHEAERPLSEVVAVLFRCGALVPLASIEPASIDGPPDRFTIPPPVRTQPAAVADLSPIEIRGPLTLRYILPTGVTRFAASAMLPVDARTWGDFELVIECDGVEIVREHFDADNATASINTELNGREFTIRLLPGERGPIQDRLVLSQAMFLRNGQH